MSSTAGAAAGGLTRPSTSSSDKSIALKPGESCRLWIGNLDFDLTELALIKVLQKYGNISKFDMLYHRHGPDRGQSKGYCFVTYSSPDEAWAAMKALDGRVGIRKRMAVKWAHTEFERGDGKKFSRTRDSDGAFTSYVDPSTFLTKEEKIRAIESKLELMNKDKTDMSRYKKKRTS